MWREIRESSLTIRKWGHLNLLIITYCVTQKVFSLCPTTLTEPGLKLFVFFQREAADVLLLAGRAAIAAAAGGAGANQQGQLPPPNPFPGLAAVPPAPGQQQQQQGQLRCTIM